jgi:hypothetical protein
MNLSLVNLDDELHPLQIIVESILGSMDIFRDSGNRRLSPQLLMERAVL